MTIVGAGAGVAELTALAVTSELAPTRKRGQYVAILIFTIVPFVPSSFYAQLIACKCRTGLRDSETDRPCSDHTNWRYVGIIVCVWNGIGFFLTLFFYFPPPRINSMGKSRAEIIREIDYIGGFLSISGMVLFMVSSYGHDLKLSRIDRLTTVRLNRLVCSGADIK
jgi:MFS family permease